MKRVISIMMVCIMLISMSITSLASDLSITGSERKEMLESIESFLNNSKSIKKDYGTPKIVGNKIVQVYDYNGNLIGYHVDVEFDGKLGYVIISTDNKQIYQIGSKSFVEIEEKQAKDRKVKLDTEKKYLFAGLSEHVVKYKEKDGKETFYNIHKNNNIKDFDKYKKDLKIKSQEELGDMIAETDMSVTPMVVDPGENWGEVSNYVENVDQDDLPYSMRSTGCGPSVGATLLWYMAENKSRYNEYLNTYNQPIDLAEKLWGDGYMHSAVTGTLPTAFKAGIRNTGNELDIIPINFNEGSSFYSELWSTIKTGIDSYNVPVALLNTIPRNGVGEEPSLAAFHWVTIFGWETYDGNDYIRYKTWGNTYTDDFLQVYRWRTGLTAIYIDETVN